MRSAPAALQPVPLSAPVAPLPAPVVPLRPAVLPLQLPGGIPGPAGPAGPAGPPGVPGTALTYAQLMGILSGTGDFAFPSGAVSWSGASGKAVTFTATGAAINFTGDATSTFKTTTGDVVVDGFAGIVWKMAGVQVLDIGVTTTTGFTVAPGKSWTFGGKLNASAAAYTIGDPGASGAIAVTADGVCPMVSAGAESRTLADPTYIGQKITLCCDTHVGDITVTAASAIDSAGHTHMAFTAAGQATSLVAITVAGAKKWRLQYNDGATLS